MWVSEATFLMLGNFWLLLVIAVINLYKPLALLIVVGYCWSVLISYWLVLLIFGSSPVIRTFPQQVISSSVRFRSASWLHAQTAARIYEIVRVCKYVVTMQM